MNRETVVPYLIVAALAALTSTASAQTQTLPCTMSSVASISCTALGLTGLQNMQQCYSSTLSACTDGHGNSLEVKDIDFYFGYLNPGGASSGTIVLLPGSNGTDANKEGEAAIAKDYAGLTSGLNFNFQVIHYSGRSIGRMRIRETTPIALT